MYSDNHQRQIGNEPSVGSTAKKFVLPTVLMLACGLASADSRTYGPIAIETVRGQIVLHDVRLWDQPSSNGQLLPRFSAHIQNLTGTTWHVAEFKVAFRCPGSTGDISYRVGIPTIESPVALVPFKERLAQAPIASPCAPASITMSMEGGWSDQGDDAANMKRLPRAEQPYGPVVVDTPYGKLIFKDVIIRDAPDPAGKVWPRFSARIENLTGTAWHVAEFKIRFRCPGSSSETSYTITVPTIESQPSIAFKESNPQFWPLPSCDPDAVRISMIGGRSDRGDDDARIAREKYLAQFPILDSGGTSVFLANDRKCSEQFVQVLAMEGLEKRKRLAELISFGCGFDVTGGVHAMRIRAEGSYCSIKLVNGEDTNKVGWVPCAWLK